VCVSLGVGGCGGCDCRAPQAGVEGGGGGGALSIVWVEFVST